MTSNWLRSCWHFPISDLTVSQVTLPVMGASGRGCSFLHRGTNTVMSRSPLSQNQFTASWRPWHENTFLSPWLQRHRSQSQHKTTSSFVFPCTLYSHASLLQFSGSRRCRKACSEFSKTQMQKHRDELRLFTCTLFHGLTLLLILKLNVYCK